MGLYRTHSRNSLGNAICNVTRGRATIRYQVSDIGEGRNKRYILVAYLQRNSVGEGRDDSHECGLLSDYVHPCEVGFSMTYCQMFMLVQPIVTLREFCCALDTSFLYNLLGFITEFLTELVN